jgi:hypothetical protein
MLISKERKCLILSIYFISILFFSLCGNMNYTRIDRKIVIDLKGIAGNHLAPVWIGTNSQIMNVIFSTGDYLSWLPASNCGSCGDVGYNPSSSADFKNFTGLHSIVNNSNLRLIKII